MMRTNLSIASPRAAMRAMLLLCVVAMSVLPSVLATDRVELVDKLGKNIHAMQLVQVQPITEAEMDSVRVLCWVNTYHKNHEKRLRSIKNTWGKKCDKLVFMSDQEDLEIPTVRIAAPPLHEMLWQKHREIVRTILREYKDEKFDWVFKCDDDTFLFVENLKKYLLSPEVTRLPSHEPVILGHRMTLQWWELQRPFNPFEDHHPEHIKLMRHVQKQLQGQGGLYYTPGGGGYALNWAYLEKLEASFDEPYCLPDEVVPDDWAISFCMWHHNVTPVDTRDAQERERFHQYDPVDLYFKPHDENAFDHNIYSTIYEENNWFSDHYNIGWKNGDNCCAPTPLASTTSSRRSWISSTSTTMARTTRREKQEEDRSNRYEVLCRDKFVLPES